MTRGDDQGQGFDAFFRARYPRLVAFAATVAGNADIADDIAQEAFSRAYRDWSKVGAYEYPDAWLRRVVTNLVIDRHRRRVNERTAHARAGRPDDLVADPPAFTEWSELIADLDPRQRAVVTLYYGEDRSVDEIAETLEMPSGSVKSILSRARSTIKAQVNSDD